MAQKDLAKKAKITTSHLSLIEAGRRVPSLTTLEKLSKGLGVPVYLIMLLAAEPGDLPGKNMNKTDELATTLLRMLTGAGRKRGKTSRSSKEV